MYKIRNFAARLSRSTPYFRGKRRLGNLVSYVVSDLSSEQACIEKIKMKNQSWMYLDARSRTEQWSYWTGYYDDEIITRLSSCLEENSIAFDIGANVGFYSVPIGATLQKLGGKLYAFEPVRSNFNRLSANISANNLEQSVFAYRLALGDEEGEIAMSMENNMNAATGNAVMVKGKVSTDYYGTYSSAQITRLDTFAEKHKIKSCRLIKIDVEGAEAMFLRGGQSFLSKARPIIYGEFNNLLMPKYGDTFLDVADMVSSWNYRFFKQDKQGYFEEVKEIKPKLEHMLLAPAETSNEVLKGLGVIF